MERIKVKPKQIVDRWSLVKPIGKGGNGIVWLARNREESVAIKFLAQVSDPRDEPFRRFCDEVKLMKNLNGHAGVMPFLGGFVGAQCNTAIPAWYAMPVAIDMMNKLGNSWTLREAVEPVAEFAKTLTKLHAEGIFHRDLKPRNFFWLNGEWVLGDFGLAAFPEQQAHDTPVQRRFGPLFYQAPEMLNAARDSAGAPADVYALAKVLWQLGTGQAYPFPGVLDVSIPAMRLSTWAGEEALTLDDVLERATLHEPAERLTMSQFAKELDTWLSSRNSTSGNLPNMENQLREISAKVKQAQDPTRILREQDACFRDAQNRMRSQVSLTELQKVYESMGSIDGVSSCGANMMSLQIALSKEFGADVQAGEPWGLFTTLGKDAAMSGIVLGLIREKNEMVVLACHRIGADIVWIKSEQIPMSGPVHEQTVSRLAAELVESTPLLIECIRRKIA